MHGFLREAVAKFYAPSSSKVKTIGITGTNGKTTACYVIAHILKCAGFPSGIIGTIACHIGDEIYPSLNTTPGFVETHQWLSRMAREKMDYCAMEVSSHALDQGRVDLIDFTCAVFTNLTDEHLDYHKSKEDYFLAKAKLFTNLPSTAHAVINADDPYGRRLMKMSKGKILTYAIDQPADIKAQDCRLGI
ncbi:MAG: UDP-N-acetylmuramoyl-L-alanyl-D-glutamate--2,6-diaminopimelate ligase, partial [Candidatus Omnitrophica bacterium CG12_big_fil_rev_8_21_14_0_65_50_5]